MQAKDLQSVSDLFQEYSNNEQQISAIRKLAIKFAEGVQNPKVSVYIPVDKPKSTAEVQHKWTDQFSRLGFNLMFPDIPESNVLQEVHEFSVTDSVVLGVLGVLLSDKIEANKVIIQKLKSLGIDTKS